MSEESSEDVYKEVVKHINKAQSVSEAEKKLESLNKVKEIILHKNPAVLDNFLDDMLGFQSDPDEEVRRFVLAFIEEASKKDPEMLSKVVASLSHLLADRSVEVQKKVVTTTEQLYQLALNWVCKSRVLNDVMDHCWEYFVQLKNRILKLLDSDNDGVRTRVIKFVEACVLLQTCKAPQSEELGSVPLLSLDDVPRDHRFISYRKLDAEGRAMFQSLLDVSMQQHISSINLISCIAGLSRIARMRPEFFEKVVLAFESIQVNLPPTLARAQVSSVRKELKKHLLFILKHPAATDFTQQITTLLNDLGVSPAQIKVSMPPPPPKEDRDRKRKKDGEGGDASKKRRREAMDEEEEGEDEKHKRRQSAIDITADYLAPKLTANNVTDLVLLSMVMLPETMPAQFQSSYTPIAKAATPDQIQHLARLIATQFTAAGLGPGHEQMKKRQKAEPAPVLMERERRKEKELPELKLPVPPPVGRSKKMQQFGLSQITRALGKDVARSLCKTLLDRILRADVAARQGGASDARLQLLSAIVVHNHSPDLARELENYILQDQKANADLAVLWLYQEYSAYQGFNNSYIRDPKEAYQHYNNCLTRLLKALSKRGEHKETLFNKIFLEAPLITDDALKVLKHACSDVIYGSFCFDLLRKLIHQRTKQRAAFVSLLAEMTTAARPELRECALAGADAVYQDGYKEPLLVAVQHLLSLLKDSPRPPAFLFDADAGREAPGDLDKVRWDEEMMKACLTLPMHLLPVESDILDSLTAMYVGASSDVKRVVLRLLDTPIKAMGMQSPAILKAIDGCPKDAETLITRMVHLLTESSPPSSDLVERIRSIYHARKLDVRFLIPILTGLSKEEVTVALPELVKLTQTVLKEVFSRLLRAHTAGLPNALSPKELLILLHQISADQSEVRGVMSAIDLLLSDRQTFTQTVVTQAISALVEIQPFPTLLMRTALEALTMYPRCEGFMQNILKRLVKLRVWENAHVWKGFVLCIQRTKPKSFQVLLDLEAEQLKQFFIDCPELRLPLLDFINGLTQTQQDQTIRKEMRDVIETNPEEYQKEAVEETTKDKEEEQSAKSGDDACVE